MYIDAHNHLDFYKENIDKAIDEINENKILTLANSMDVKSYLKNKKFKEKSKYIKLCFGIHPSRAHMYKDDLKFLVPYIEESKIIGEIGLDFFWVEDKSTYKNQRRVFNFLLDEAIKRGKFVNLHTKGAELEIYNALFKRKYNKAIVHWYSGDINLLDKFIKLGCYFTISVDIGYSKKTEDVLNKIPLNRLLIETDGPTAMEWVNGKYAYPSEIINVAREVAKFKEIDFNTLLKILEENYNDIINN